MKTYKSKKIFRLISCLLILCCSSMSNSEINECETPNYPDQYPVYSPQCDNDNITPIKIDTENSATVIDFSSSGNVTIVGGIEDGEYLWKISGNGFYFDAGYSITSLVTKEKTVSVFTSEEACGTGQISIYGANQSPKLNSCLNTQHTVASTKGRWGAVVGGGWGQRYGEAEFIPGAIALCGVEGHTTYRYSSSRCMEADNGIYLQKICYTYLGGCGTGSGGCYPEPVGLCNDYCTNLPDSIPEVGGAVSTSPYFTSYKVIEYQQCFTNMPDAEVSYRNYLSDRGIRNCGCSAYAIHHAGYQKWECN